MIKELILRILQENIGDAFKPNRRAVLQGTAALLNTSGVPTTSETPSTNLFHNIIHNVIHSWNTLSDEKYATSAYGSSVFHPELAKIFHDKEMWDTHQFKYENENDPNDRYEWKDYILKQNVRDVSNSFNKKLVEHLPSFIQNNPHLKNHPALLHFAPFLKQEERASLIDRITKPFLNRNFNPANVVAKFRRTKSGKLDYEAIYDDEHSSDRSKIYSLIHGEDRTGSFSKIASDFLYHDQDADMFVQKMLYDSGFKVRKEKAKQEFLDNERKDKIRKLSHSSSEPYAIQRNYALTRKY